MKKTTLLIILFALICSLFVLADSFETKFSNGNSTQNFTFSGNENITYNLSLPIWANINSFTFTAEGFLSTTYPDDVYLNLGHLNNESDWGGFAQQVTFPFDYITQSSYTQYYGFNITTNASTLFRGVKRSSKSNSSRVYVYNISNALLLVNQTYDSNNESFFTLTADENWGLLFAEGSDGAAYIRAFNQSSGIYPLNYSTWHISNGMFVNSMFNINIDATGAYGFTDIYTGGANRLNETAINAVASYADLNIILNSNCTGYTIVNNHCQIEFKLHSNQSGIAQISNLNISYINQTLLTAIVKNGVTLEILHDYNFTVNTDMRANVTAPYFRLNPTTHTVNISKSGYIPYNANYVTNSYGHFVTTIFNLSANATFNLIDEVTLGAFNISGTDSVYFFLYCPSTTEVTQINSTLFSLPIGCDYSKFKFVVSYGSESYYRTFIQNDTINASIYLIDLLTTQSIFNNFILDDLFQLYDNPSIIIKRNFPIGERLITADFTDIENKIGAYLVQNYEYNVYVYSDNQPVLVVGSYSADLAGDQVIRLYGFQIDPIISGFSENVAYTTSLVNLTNGTAVVTTYIDTAAQTSQLQWNIYLDSLGGTNLASVSSVNQSATFRYDIPTIYNQSTLYAVLNITHSTGEYSYVKLVQENTANPLGIEEYLSTNFLRWFLTLIIGTLALMSTIKTANVMSMVLIGLSSIFVIFKWYPLSWGVLVLATVVSLLAMLKEGSNRQEVVR